MDKLTMAHEYALEMAKQGIPLKSCKELGWKYADAMQAEAEERVNKERPEALCEVDWNAAPENAFQWQMISNEAYWRIEIMGGLDTEPAPSFGFTGSHIMVRPQ